MNLFIFLSKRQLLTRSVFEQTVTNTEDQGCRHSQTKELAPQHAHTGVEFDPPLHVSRHEEDDELGQSHADHYIGEHVEDGVDAPLPLLHLREQLVLDERLLGSLFLLNLEVDLLQLARNCGELAIESLHVVLRRAVVLQRPEVVLSQEPLVLGLMLQHDVVLLVFRQNAKTLLHAVSSVEDVRVLDRRDSERSPVPEGGSHVGRVVHGFELVVPSVICVLVVAHSQLAY